MKIGGIYSHLNGREFLEARKPKLWKEIQSVIKNVNAAQCLGKISKEKRMQGKVLYAPKRLNTSFKKVFKASNWAASTTSFYVCEDERTNRKIVEMAAPEQKKAIIDAGFKPYSSKNETDFVKDRVAVEVQFGKYSFIAYDLIVKHMAFFVAGKIDVGVEIVPMKCLQKDMSSGPGYFEKELFNLTRQGRGVPPVPLVLIGIEP